MIQPLKDSMDLKYLEVGRRTLVRHACHLTNLYPLWVLLAAILTAYSIHVMWLTILRVSSEAILMSTNSHLYSSSYATNATNANGLCNGFQ